MTVVLPVPLEMVQGNHLNEVRVIWPEPGVTGGEDSGGVVVIGAAFEDRDQGDFVPVAGVELDAVEGCLAADASWRIGVMTQPGSGLGVWPVVVLRRRSRVARSEGLDPGTAVAGWTVSRCW